MMAETKTNTVAIVGVGRIGRRDRDRRRIVAVEAGLGAQPEVAVVARGQKDGLSAIGRGERVLAPSPARAQIAATLQAAGIPTQISDDVARALWSKLVLNCAYNPLSALTQLSYGEIVQSPDLPVAQVMDDVVRECLAVARASGVELPESLYDSVRQLAASMPTQTSSTAQDLARGRRSEIDHLNGYIVRRGAALGLDTPVNRLLHTLVRLLEKRVVQNG